MNARVGRRVGAGGLQRVEGHREREVVAVLISVEVGIDDDIRPASLCSVRVDDAQGLFVIEDARPRDDLAGPVEAKLAAEESDRPVLFREL